MEIIDNVNKTVKQDLIVTLREGSKVAIDASCFSIYAFQELKEQLGEIAELRFIFTSPSFITDRQEKQKREFYIPSLSREHNSVNIYCKNRLHPIYMVYIRSGSLPTSDNNILVNHLEPKDLLDRLRKLCKGKSEPIMELCRKFNAETSDGQHMGTYFAGDPMSSATKSKALTILN